MFQRSMLCVVVLLWGCGSLKAEDWCCRFAKERALAVKRAGPQVSKESKHVHVVAKEILPPSVPVTPKPPIPIKVERPVRKKASLTRPPERESREITEKARLAYENGQLEQALRLYQLAKKMKPDSVEVEKRITEIETELR